MAVVAHTIQHTNSAGIALNNLPTSLNEPKPLIGQSTTQTNATKVTNVGNIHQVISRVIFITMPSLYICTHLETSY
jgi:hypothetical protein